MERKTECPLCRTEINVKELKTFSKKLDKLLKEEESKTDS